MSKIYTYVKGILAQTPLAYTYLRYRAQKRIKYLKKIKPRIEKILVLYHIPKSNAEKYHCWEDGFTHCFHDHVAKHYNVTFMNLADHKPTLDELNQYDLVVSKWGFWNNYMRKFKEIALKNYKAIKFYSCIHTSGSVIPRTKSDLFQYDIIWYQTNEQAQACPYDLSKCLNLLKAFAINTATFHPMPEVEKTIDVLTIGAIESRKRPWLINTLPGERKMLIGDNTYSDSAEIIQQLNDNVKVKPYASQKELALLINQSKLVAFFHTYPSGGGERAVLEAKACGAKLYIHPEAKHLHALNDANEDFTPQGMAEKFINCIRNIAS